MRTIPFSSAFDAAATSSGTRVQRPSLFSRIMARIAAAQERKALQVVAAQLSTYSDEALVDLGWSAERIAALRKAGSVSVATPL